MDIFARHKAITVTGARAAAKDVFSAWQPPCRSARLFPNFTVSNGCFIQNFFARPKSYHSQKYSTAEVFDCFKMLQSASLVRKWRRRMPSMPRSRSPAQRKRQLHPIGSRWQRMLIMNGEVILFLAQVSCLELSFAIKAPRQPNHHQHCKPEKVCTVPAFRTGCIQHGVRNSRMPASTGQYGSQCGNITMRYSIIHSPMWSRRICDQDIKRSPSIFAGSSECFSPYILLSPHWSVHRTSICVLARAQVHKRTSKVAVH